jgi:4-amino-4-deoxychorismate lyase
MSLIALAVSGRGLVDPDEPVVYADDEGFLRGRAAFETTRVYGGRPFRLEQHRARLWESSKRLNLSIPAGVDDLLADVLAAAGPVDAVLRLYVTPGREGRDEPVVLALVADLPAELEELRTRGIRLIPIALGVDPPWLLGGIKSTSYAANMVAVDVARLHGADDAIFIARDRIVLEGPTTNIWWRRGDTLFTPSLELGVLAGVTREVLVQAAPALGYHVEEGVYPLEDLLGADEAFTSSSVREVMPVAAVGSPGPVTFPPGDAARALQAALRALT